MTKNAHISIDDVTNAMQRLSKGKYSSIYEEAFFRYLRILHKVAGLKITLYLYTTQKEWTLTDIPDRYKGEFEESRDWLKFGFHAVSDEQKQDEVMPDWAECVKYYQEQVIRFAGELSLAKVIRLHYWYYPEEYIKILKLYGIQTILVRRDDSSKEICGIPAWHTKIRLEQDKHIERQIWNYHLEEPLVLFTHEWALGRRNMLKLAFAAVLLKLRGYTFICE